MDNIEPLLLEMTEEHKMQWYEILNIIKGYLEVHCLESRETYNDETHPVMYYGHKEGLK